MNVTVTAVDGEWVTFSCDAGVGQGRWVGATPVIGLSAPVEVDVSGEVPWASIRVVPFVSAFIERLEGETVRMRGVVLSVDEEMVLELQVGDSILMLDTTGEPPIGVVGEAVELEVSALTVFPVDY